MIKIVNQTSSIFVLMLLFVFSANAQPGKFASPSSGGKGPLAKVFRGNDGGAFYCTEVGKKVYMFAEHPGKNYSYVIQGTRSGKTINAKFWGVPKEGSTKTGNFKLQVQNNGSLKLVGSGSGFPAKTLTVTSIGKIKSKLPRPGKPAFNTLKFNDLDGGFKDKSGYHYYFRQIGSFVVVYCERDFSKGKQPSGAFVLIGSRNGDQITGTITALPKGLKKGFGGFNFKVMPNLHLIKSSGINFGGKNLIPTISINQNIEIPISIASDILGSQLKKIKITLDGYDKHGQPKKNGAVIKIPGIPALTYTLPYLQVITCPKCGKRTRTFRRTFINDLHSDIIQLQKIGKNRLKMIVGMEPNGREVKRFVYMEHHLSKNRDGKHRDNLMADWDLQNPRIDVEFSLINKTVNKKKSISFRVDKAKVYAWVDIPAVPDDLEKWIMSKFRPKVERSVKDFLNGYQDYVAELLYDKLQQSAQYINQYKVLGYNVLNVKPKGIRIQGDKVVFLFK